MASQRLRRHIEAATGEINLVPYMDIVVNLILFLMLTSTGFIQFAVINGSAPMIGAGDTPIEEPKDPPLNLTIGVTDRGFIVAGLGGSLQPPGAQTEPNVPKVGVDYNYQQLTQKLIEIKASFRHETKVIITASPTIPYEVIVKVMDASRQNGKEELFPDVLISPGFVEG